MNPLVVSAVFKEIKTSCALSSYSSNSLSSISGGEVVPNFRSAISNVFPPSQATWTAPTYLLYKMSDWLKPKGLKNLPSFVSPGLKLHNRYCHTIIQLLTESGTYPQLATHPNSYSHTVHRCVLPVSFLVDLLLS